MDGTTPTSLYTSCTFITPSNKTSLQLKKELDPNAWRQRHKDADICQPLLSSFEDYDDLFRHYRRENIRDTLTRVESEQRLENGEVRDGIDREDLSATSHSLSRDDLYGHIPSNHFKSPHIAGAEPVFKNPGRKEDLHEIFEHIKTQAKVKSSEDGRQWVIAGCDGSPYILGQQIIDHTFNCPICKTVFDEETICESHIRTEHQLPDIKPQRKYVPLLRIGQGRYEMNIAKALMKFMWYPCLQRFAYLLGFRSPAAQNVIKKLL